MSLASRRRTFRASVVSVAAAFAPSAGCHEEPEARDIGNPPCTSGGCVPAPTECPAVEPSAGGSCDLANGDSCSYGERTVSCRGNTWHVAAPLDAAVEAACPVDEPRANEPCSQPESLDCSYRPCNGLPSLSARCSEGRWSLAESSCNPPYMPCPEEPPVVDTTCTLWGTPEKLCSYPADDAGVAPVTYECATGVWHKLPAPVCPTLAPVAGAACAPLAAPCKYGDCYGVPTIQAECVESAWQVAEQTCNPPPIEP